MGNLVSLRQALAAIAPAVALLAAALALTLPVRLFQGFVPMPWISAIIVYLYAVRDPDAMPAPLAFASGLLLDLLTGAAPGVWASVHLAILWLVRTQSDYLYGREGTVLWLTFGIMSFVVSILLYAEYCLLAGRWLQPAPVLWQWAVTVMAYPLASGVFEWLRRRAAREIGG